MLLRVADTQASLPVTPAERKAESRALLAEARALRRVAAKITVPVSAYEFLVRARALERRARKLTRFDNKRDLTKP